jgi:hypothetical protein
MLVWKRRDEPDPERLGNLTLWEAVDDEDGDEHVLWAEMTPDPGMADAVAQVKQVLREHGWSRTAGD